MDFSVTKFVRSGDSHNPTHISQNARIKAVLRRSQETLSKGDSGQKPKSYHFDRWGLDTGARALPHFSQCDDGGGVVIRRIGYPFARYPQKTSSYH